MTDSDVTIKDMLKNHFKDDEGSFTDIRQKLEKHNELLAINGEHFSHFRKDITEIKNILLKQDEVMKQHIARVEPAIKKFESEKTAMEYNKAIGEKVVEISKLVLAIGAIGGAIIWFVKKLL